MRWMAPESLTDDTIDVKTMVWMFGVLIWEIFTFGTMPWKELDSEDIVSKVRKGNTLDRPLGCPDRLFQVMVH